MVRRGGDLWASWSWLARRFPSLSLLVGSPSHLLDYDAFRFHVSFSRFVVTIHCYDSLSRFVFTIRRHVSLLRFVFRFIFYDSLSRFAVTIHFYDSLCCVAMRRFAPLLLLFAPDRL